MTEHGSTVPPRVDAIAADGVQSPITQVITEFGRHLDILAEQLGDTMMEADRECISVGESFHELAAAKTAVAGIVCPEPEKTVLRRNCTQMGESLHAAVIALQYHDRLAQRLGLIRAGLDRLQRLLHDGSTRSADAWLNSLREVERVNRAERMRLGRERDAAPGIAGTQLPVSDSSVELF